MTIYFDLDGTLANLYGVTNWLEKLRLSDPSPYVDAKPFHNVNRMQTALIALQNTGFKIGIISWLSKDASPTYAKQIRSAKKEWLKKSYPSIVWDEIHIVKYGTKKHYIANEKGGILFDDERQNRASWNGKAAFDEKNILKNLQNLLDNA